MTSLKPQVRSAAEHTFMPTSTIGNMNMNLLEHSRFSRARGAIKIPRETTEYFLLIVDIRQHTHTHMRTHTLKHARKRSHTHTHSHACANAYAHECVLLTEWAHSIPVTSEDTPERALGYHNLDASLKRH